MTCHAVAANFDPPPDPDLATGAFVIVAVGTPSLIRKIIQMRK